MIEWMKKNRKELLLPFLCFVLGLLLAIASIQVQEQGTDTKEDQTLTHFQPKDYKNLVSKEQEIKQFKWTIEAVANLKVRLKQSQQPGTRLETVVTEWGKAQKVKYTKTAQGEKTVLVLTYAAKQTDQGKKSVTLWFEQEKDQGYRLTMVDATNLLDVKEKTSSEKEITTEKEKKGTEFAQLIQQLGNPQRLVWGEMPDGGMGYRATYQLPGQPEVMMEFKKKAKKLVLV
ncbi:hypothetical protein KJR05_08725 [Streptococcus parasanguinis]|uniref:hypothetical protein n=1 Tax=Streptococcus parasanguinis TaxID=1318 RepID=UPI001BD92FBB|nr:hypothetical protein [Streptococcus parasanguinis]MBT0908054.1 hypothetical protein [Streptococcus parasanguinis]MBT0927516.1 hypothetical protein [Streptococcus parasanguinis]